MINNKRRLDLTGQRFGSLVVLERSTDVTYKSGQTHTMWKCKCDCGNECIVSTNSLRCGATKSCGCRCFMSQCPSLAANKKLYRRIYKIWFAMLARCENPKNHAYELYGGRGIKVCDEWHSLEEFAKWTLENGYDETLTIDRIDFDGDYSPSNCRWATMKEQQNNRSNNRVIEYNGAKHTLSEWAEILGIERHNLTNRLNRGWTVERAFTTPVGKYRKAVV